MVQRGMIDDPVTALLPPSPPLAVEPLLDAIREQADEADRTRNLDASVVAALKANDVVVAAASVELGGPGATVLQIGRELEAVAGACTSTAWVLWNHLAVFHLFVGCLGPDHQRLLRGVVEAGETVCFPAGASSGVRGVIEGDQVRLSGKGAFGSGGRYADWAGVAFVVVDDHGDRVEPLDLRFTIVPVTGDGVRIEATWDGSAVRASATDDVHYDDVVAPLARCVPWYGANRAETLREVPVVAPRYREDWVGLSDVWLAWMGVGLVGSALRQAIAETTGRRSILGKRMVTHPTVQLNLGEAAALLAAAAATAETACRQVDERITAAAVPTEADYLGQMALASAALAQLDQAMQLIRRALGGNGLREGGFFDRYSRDFQAMPLHINAHRDRVNLRLGRFALGEEQDPF
ncbi:MAG: acyl-CoA dehydrogenase family protein [Acidimicrobiia bacterium]|nr:acyl-CoA dehydrogenase family protein [Acidimicrobiia bacterium]